ncbi:hypothetical protein HCN44_010035 [Aphidius gifuensis]|uniref:Uncharacterized protein n=2 Tax=Aphidius gifuensis TaxID=684658 RepID=A0A835CUK5_APHGI|nr:hypothetical protein HCN44_010035 [Aphidius gifuensis]
MRVPEAIVESTTLNCETLRNQEDSQISLDLTQLVGKPLEISENIHKTWITTNNQNYQKLYVLTVDVDAYKNPSAKVSEIFDDPIDSKSQIMFEAQNLIEDIINELELSFKNDKITGKSIFDSTSLNLDFNNKSINSHTEHRKLGSKIPLRVVSRHRLHSNKLDIQ